MLNEILYCKVHEIWLEYGIWLKSRTAEEVCEQVALVHLVENDHLVLREQLVGGQLAEQQTLREEHDARVLRALAIEPDLS